MCEEIVFMNSSALNSKNKKMQRNGQKTVRAEETA